MADCLTGVCIKKTSKSVVSKSIPGGTQLCRFAPTNSKITPAWKFLVILKTLISWTRCVWLGLELNCAELCPSRNWVWDKCSKSRLFRYYASSSLKESENLENNKPVTHSQFVSSKLDLKEKLPPRIEILGYLPWCQSNP